MFKNKVLSLNKNKEIMKKGDIVIGINKETKEPIVLPLLDRFLHTLILSPSGSTKSSTMIPMIYQDIENSECGITVIAPSEEITEKIYEIGKKFNRNVTYFNPTLNDCPYFNPLQGGESEVIENTVMAFNMINTDYSQSINNANEILIRKSLLVLKRLMGDKATLIELATLIHNSEGAGRKIVLDFARINAKTESEAKENADVASWFLSEYFNENSKLYEDCSVFRLQIAKITSNKYLKKVLNPPNGASDIDFVEHLKGNGILTISTAQVDLRELDRLLGYFVILNLQSAVFRRPGTDQTRKYHFLYIDEFQNYSNPGFANMLTQGRPYRVASHLSTQNRALMAMGFGRYGEHFVELVSTNIRNVVVCPGVSHRDAEYYAKLFNEIDFNAQKHKVTQKKSIFNKLKYFNKKKTLLNESLKCFSPNDIMYKPFGEMTCIIVNKNSLQAPINGITLQHSLFKNIDKI